MAKRALKKKTLSFDDLKKKFSSRVKYKEQQFFDLGKTFQEVCGIAGPAMGQINMFLGHSDTGKSQPLSSKILTPNGWATMGDIELGAEIIGSDGEKQTVIGIYPQGTRPVYKVTLKDGAVVYCDEEHLWSVNQYKDRHKGKKDQNDVKRYAPDNSFTTMKLSDMIDNVKVKTGEYYSCNYKLPRLSPVSFTNKSNLVIEPYVLGCFLGDGSYGFNNDIVKISTTDSAIINEVSKTKHYRVDKTYKRKIYENDVLVDERELTSIKLTNETKKNLLSLGLDVRSDEKFIPTEYIYSTTIDDRISLLQGLLDTDGSVDKRSGTAYYYTSSPKLKDNVIELVNSLGGKTNVTSKIPTYKYEGERKTGKRSYTISVILDGISPFRLERKASLYKDNSNTSRYIDSIEYSHEEECQCIKVSNSDELYITDGFVLTHNTTALIKSAVDAQKKNVLPVFLITEQKWSFEYAKLLGFDCEQKVDEETGELYWDGFFIDKVGFNYIEQAFEYITELLDAQAKGDIPYDLLFLWDSIGTIPCEMSFNGKGGNQHTARVISEKWGMGLAQRITSSRKEDSQYTNTMVFVNQPWVQIPEGFGSLLY